MSRPLLAPLEFLYAAGLRLKYARPGVIGYERLAWPVVSIGNLSLGGSGKTPFTILLLRLLAQRGWSADVLARGYRRGDGGDFADPERVLPEGSAFRYGDEPLMIARLTGAPVFVGPSRYAAGLLAEREVASAAKRVHLLDDGFQHRRLARAADIVLVHRSDLTGHMLPRGRLREPLSALTRADVLVLRDEDEDLADRIGAFVRPGGFLWRVRREMAIPERPGRVLAFCAIAKPEEFYRSLRETGADVAVTRSFRDHHRFRPADIDEIAELGRRGGCDGFITTEKDAVKLDAAMRSRMVRVAPLLTARLSLRLEREEEAVDQLLSLLGLAGGAS